MLKLKEILEKLKNKGAKISEEPYKDGIPNTTCTWSIGTLYSFTLNGIEGYILDDMVYSKVGIPSKFVSAKYNNEWIADNFTQTGYHKINKWVDSL